MGRAPLIVLEVLLPTDAWGLLPLMQRKQHWEKHSQSYPASAQCHLSSGREVVEEHPDSEAHPDFEAEEAHLAAPQCDSGSGSRSPMPKTWPEIPQATRKVPGLQSAQHLQTSCRAKQQALRHSGSPLGLLVSAATVETALEAVAVAVVAVVAVPGGLAVATATVEEALEVAVAAAAVALAAVVVAAVAA